MNRSLLSRHDRIAARVFERVRDPVLLLVRVAWGWSFFRTGAGKLGNLAGTTEFFRSLGLPFASANALLVGLVECIGGLLLLAGLGSRSVALLLALNMVVAYLTAHTASFGSLDAFVAAAPFPFLMASLMVFAAGPGRLSLDALLRRRLAGHLSANAEDCAVPAGSRPG